MTHSSWGHESDPPIKFTGNRLPKGHHPAARALRCWKLQKNKEMEENEDGSTGPRTLLGAGAGGPFAGASPRHSDQAMPGRESPPASLLQEANSKRADADG